MLCGVVCVLCWVVWCVVWCDVVWCGVLWCGVVWCVPLLAQGVGKAAVARAFAEAVGRPFVSIPVGPSLSVTSARFFPLCSAVFIALGSV